MRSTAQPARSENRPLNNERFAHGAIYAARPDVRTVLCANSDDVVPFGITGVPLRPVLGTVGDMGSPVPVWDIADEFGEGTDLTISTPERGRSLAKALGAASAGADARRRLRRDRAHAQRRGEDVGLHPEELARAGRVADGR